MDPSPSTFPLHLQITDVSVFFQVCFFDEMLNVISFHGCLNCWQPKQKERMDLMLLKEKERKLVNWLVGSSDFKLEEIAEAEISYC